MLAGTYRTAVPVSTLLVRNLLLVDASLDANLAQALTGALFAEQQRLLKRKLAFEKRLVLMASRRAARAAQPEIDSPVADPGAPHETRE